MGTVSSNLYRYLKNNKISIVKLSRNTGIKYNPLWNSLSGKRELSGEELLTICSYLDVDPYVFRAQIADR